MLYIDVRLPLVNNWFLEPTWILKCGKERGKCGALRKGELKSTKNAYEIL